MRYYLIQSISPPPAAVYRTPLYSVVDACTQTEETETETREGGEAEERQQKGTEGFWKRRRRASPWSRADYLTPLYSISRRHCCQPSRKNERREDRGKRKKRRKEGEAGKRARARASERASESELRRREKEREQETAKEKREREADRGKKRQRRERNTHRERVTVRVRERKENHEADAASRDSAISAVSLSGGEWLAL